jgi:eukaryotic-like serine/threonine-protein kinase
MNANRYQKIKEIFNRAAEMALLERQDFVNAVCDDDSEMRREVEKMLVFADDADDTLEKNAFEIFTDGKTAKIPTEIGDYKILREIGRGGMGAVYEAVRENKNFRQRVALKVIKRGMDTDAVVSRFRHEQKILASLEYPNASTSASGRITRDSAAMPKSRASRKARGNFTGNRSFTSVKRMKRRSGFMQSSRRNQPITVIWRWRR